MRSICFIALLPVLLSLGCHRPGAPPPPADPAAAVAPVATASHVPLFERLQREAKARPDGTPRFEDVDGALARAGMSLAGRKQVLAETVGASYCAAARTASGLGLAVCEFPSAESARRGRRHSQDTFGSLIPHRTLVVNRKTLLTLTRPDDSAALVTASATAASIFTSL